jgi:hypothetical protein
MEFAPGQTRLNCGKFLMRAARRDPLHAWRVRSPEEEVAVT